MTFVVTESCIRCKYTECVEVCPVDAFREGPNFLVIDPEDCIDCAVCVPECPVSAIFAVDDVPGPQQHFTALNAELARVWTPITHTKAALTEWLRVFRSCPLTTPKRARSSLQMLAIARAMSVLCAWIGHLLGRCSGRLEFLSASDAETWRAIKAKLDQLQR